MSAVLPCAARQKAGCAGSRLPCSPPSPLPLPTPPRTQRALALGFGSVTVKLKGAGSNKQVAVQSLHAAGLRIRTLMDVTPIPYNGCRQPKRRRV